MKPRKFVPRISAKRLAANGGRMPFSSIAPSQAPQKQKTRTKIRAVNPEAEQRRKALRRKKHRAYRSSETFKIVAARAGGRCEFTVTHMQEGGFAHLMRCDETEGLEHHHRRYGRQYGGNERSEDMQVLCKQHHRWMEATQHPTRKR